MTRLTVLKMVAAIIGMVALSVFADGGGSKKSGSPLAPYQKLIEEQQYQQAITQLDTALGDDPDDADLLNLLAYSHRKLERLDIALDLYLKALQIKPRHRGANEYLGELYLLLGQLDKAEQRLAVLDKACFFGCDEYDELEQAIETYRKENPS